MEALKIITVGSLMTANPVAIRPETTLIEAANLLSKKHFNGLPVVDKNGVAIGIVTDHDFLTKGSAIHLPTFVKLLEGFPMYRNDDLAVSGGIKKIMEMRVKDIMNPEPFTLFEDATVEEGLRAFAEHHRVNPILIVDRNKKLRGILSRHDIIKMFGGPASLTQSTEVSGRPIDQNVNNLLSDFKAHFLVVSKTRTRYWFLWDVLFAVVGFLIAFALIVQF